MGNSVPAYYYDLTHLSSYSLINQRYKKFGVKVDTNMKSIMEIIDDTLVGARAYWMTIEGHLHAKEWVINLIIIFNCLLVIFSAIGIYNTRPNGYEVSLYTSIPMYIWAMWYCVIISSLIILIYDLYSCRLSKKYWYSALVLFFICGIIFTSLPIIRGYTYWGRGDPISHRQWINEILSTGHIPEGLIYPIAHEWIVEYFYLSGLPTEIMLLYINILLVIPSILFLYLLAKFFLTSITQRRLYAIYLITMFSGMGIYFFPSTLANKIYPLIVWLFLLCIGGRSNKIPEFTLLLSIMIILIVPFHPNATMALLVIFVTLGAYAKYSFTTTKKSVLTRNPVEIVALLSIVFMLWLSQFYLFDKTISAVARTIRGEIEETALYSLMQNIDYAATYGYNPLEMFLKTYGNSLVVIAYATIAFFILLKQVKLDKNIDACKILSLSLPIIAFFIITALMYLVDLGFGPERMFSYGTSLCAILMIFVLDIIGGGGLKISNHTIRLGPMVIFVSFILMNSLMVMTYYHSPFLLTSNDQFTQNEEKGVMWFTTCAQETQNATFISLTEYMRRKGYNGTYPPYHFNYNNSCYLGTGLSSDRYMILNKLDRHLYTDVWPEMAQYRWYLSDFIQLRSDSSVDRYYTNGETEIWYVHALS